MNDRTKGLLIILAGVVAVSPDAVLVRFLSENGTPPWTIVFWKMLLGFPLTTAYALYESGGLRPLRRTIVRGRRYYAAAVPFQCAVNICFSLAFVFTNAAQALLLINLNPLWCALVGRWFLGDKLPTRTYIALALSLGCVLIIFVPEVVERKQGGDDEVEDVKEEEDPYADTATKGNILSLLAGLSLAAYISIVRWAGKAPGPKIDMVGTASFGGILSFVIALIVDRGVVLPAHFWTGVPSHFWLAVAAEGLTVGAIFVSMGIAPKLITGAEVGLCVLLEAVLGPLFVFFAYRDVPSKWTLIGGSLLLVVLALHESRPLFIKAKEVQRSLSRRISSRVLRGSILAEQAQQEHKGKGKELHVLQKGTNNYTCSDSDPEGLAGQEVTAKEDEEAELWKDDDGT